MRCKHLRYKIVEVEMYSWGLAWRTIIATKFVYHLHFFMNFPWHHIISNVIYFIYLLNNMFKWNEKLSGEIHKYMQISNVLKSYFSLPKIKVTLTNSSINHLNPNFAHLGRGNVNVFKYHGLVWFICHRSFITKSHMNSQSPYFDSPKFKANHNSIHHPLAKCNTPMYE